MNWINSLHDSIAIPDYIGQGIAAARGVPYVPSGSPTDAEKAQGPVQDALHSFQGAVDAGIQKATGGISDAINNSVASLEAKVGPALARIGVALVALVLIGGAIWLLAQTAKAAPAAVAA